MIIYCQYIITSVLIPNIILCDPLKYIKQKALSCFGMGKRRDVC